MKLKSTLAALIVLAATTAAHATSSLTTEINAPSVSATGAFSWLDLGYSLSTQVQDQAGWLDANTANFAPALSNYSYGTTASVSSAAGNMASASLTGQTLMLNVSTGSHGGTAMASLDVWGTFSLAPGASMTLSWQRSISGSNAGQSVIPNGHDYLNGMVVNTSTLISGAWTGFTPIYNTGNVGSGESFSIADKARQTVSFTNTLNTTLVGEMRGSVQVYTRDAVAAVPEADSVSLAIAGLAVIGGAAWGRKRRG